jgi:hypothetical protein
MNITKIRHPDYNAMVESWAKWRSVYKGGDSFIEDYVSKFSDRETETDFQNRKKITPIAAFAKGAINDIKNAIFQRTVDITREGGPKSYQEAVTGKGLGVDMNGESMNTFIGRDIIGELLTMSKVGVFVDMPEFSGESLADSAGVIPYLYVYKAEDILSWAHQRSEEGFYFSQVLLRDYINEYDPDTNLVTDTIERYRFLYLDGTGVTCEFYNDDGKRTDKDGIESEGTSYTIDVPYIPFAIAELSDSLLADVSNHQIAATNMQSSDVSYAIRANFPFYVEQFDPRAETWNREANPDGADGTAEEAAIGKPRQTPIGGSVGRRYPIGTDSPGFIHPSSEPLEISIKKQDQLKEEIRQLLALALSNIKPKMASAESKELDQQGLEAGLSYIGLELENFERQISKFWAMYEGGEAETTINYPRKYSLESDSEIQERAAKSEALLHKIPSITYQKEKAKQIASITLAHQVSAETLKQINGEIDAAKVVNVDPDVISKDVENGLVDPETASELRGYPKGTAAKAEQAHADRLARIAASQSEDGAARGVPDKDDTPSKTASNEKKMSTNKDDKNISNKQRGKGKDVN